MKKLTTMFIAALLIAAIYVITKDLGDHNSKPGGAGEIWWTQVPEIEAFYQNISKE
ncbi:hypothetical protein [Clostridium thermarum]|uniref:hypothetical protein n=1 Tax=Clostridium thermarum TaxID=1716543 RepID=UPI0013D45CC3|nr:hypothetical protein [Clostridium thermarum]